LEADKLWMNLLALSLLIRSLTLALITTHTALPGLLRISARSTLAICFNTVRSLAISATLLPLRLPVVICKLAALLGPRMAGALEIPPT